MTKRLIDQLTDRLTDLSAASDLRTRRMPPQLCDPDVSWLEVPTQVFDQEHQRRLRLWNRYLDDQMPKRIQQYQQDLEQWQSRYLNYEEVPLVARQIQAASFSRKRVNEAGRYVPKPTAPPCPKDPRLSIPTWQDVQRHVIDKPNLD